MSDYDPQRDRRRPTEAAIDAVMGASGPPDPGSGPADDVGANGAASEVSDAIDGPVTEVIDLSEPADTGLSSPVVTPDPAPSDEVLVRLGIVGSVVGALGAGYLWRRLRRRRRSA